MSLTDIAQPSVTITDHANSVREKMAQIIAIADVRLHQIRNIVRAQGRSAIAAELGADAADMLTVYTKLKEAIETAKQIEIDDLP